MVPIRKFRESGFFVAEDCEAEVVRNWAVGWGISWDGGELRVHDCESKRSLRLDGVNDVETTSKCVVAVK